MIKELRWHRRLKNFKQALTLLGRIVNRSKQEGKSETVKLAALLSFKQNFILAIDCMMEFFKYQGDVYLEPGKMIIRLAFRRGLIEDGETWMDMLKAYEQHGLSYHQTIADKISSKTVSIFYPVFLKLSQELEQHRLQEEEFERQYQKGTKHDH